MQNHWELVLLSLKLSINILSGKLSHSYVSFLHIPERPYFPEQWNHKLNDIHLRRILYSKLEQFLYVKIWFTFHRDIYVACKRCRWLSLNRNYAFLLVHLAFIKTRQKDQQKCNLFIPICNILKLMSRVAILEAYQLTFSFRTILAGTDRHFPTCIYGTINLFNLFGNKEIQKS